jgi:hypothetical protein
MGFITLCFMALVLAGTMFVEVVIYFSDSVNSSYALLGVAGGLQFLTSGLILKAGSFPLWMRAWVPSISLMRWIMQAGFIAVYDGDTDTFPARFPNSTFTLYIAYLQLFGWGGKTKWYCFGMLVVEIMVFRFLCLVTSAYAAFKSRGTHRVAIQH